ncbi:LysR family transcriptional regulator (plasmid) [Shinella sp. H4-D48]|uniref:LysR family transcriptional regulator n=1 Tax=Shinella sp. H4-D48 TaxID=2925841 RepID=UPI001F538E00|nr:LysR family transcriptional regulator [Shinella sp. H4-D48]UNK39994.1 LysR family transcriptional regulator [Shinella sp. H4-D48]
MEIRQIEMFVAAAEEQHFSKAAERCHIVQSGLSAAIKGLEDEIGTSLFIRTTRRVELSPAGQIFLPEARRVLAALTAAQKSIGAVKAGSSGRLVVSIVQSLAPFLDIPQMLQSFKDDHPNVEISVRETRPGDLNTELRRGSVDVAFMPLYGMNRIGLEVASIFSSRLVVACGKGHSLSKRIRVPFEALGEEPFVDVSMRWDLRKLVDQVFRSNGVNRTTSFEVDELGLLLEFVERGFGLAMIPEAMIQGRTILTLDIDREDDEFPMWELGMFWAKHSGGHSANPAADLFREDVLTSLER